MILTEAAQVGLELLAADGAVVSASAFPDPATTVRVRVDEEDAASLLSSLEPAIRRSTERRGPVEASLGSRSALVLSLAAGEPGAFAVFLGREDAAWDRRLAETSAAQACAGDEKARMHERERQLLLQYQRLSELGTELVTAPDASEVRRRLLARTPEILSADLCFIALLDRGPDAITVEVGSAAAQATDDQARRRCPPGIGAAS